MLLSVLGLSINALAIAPIYISPAEKPSEISPKTSPKKTTFSVLLSNVLSSNLSKNKLVTLVQQQAADFLVVLEVNYLWAKELEAIHSDYPYRKILPRADNFGIALYSKHPLTNIQIHDFAHNEIPSLTAHSVKKAGKYYSLQHTLFLL